MFYQPTERSACLVHAANAPAYRIAEAIANSNFGAPQDASDSQEELELKDLPSFDLVDSQPIKVCEVRDIYHAA